MSTLDSSDREVFGAYLSDDETASLLTPIIHGLGWSGANIHQGGIANAVRSLGIMSSPEFLIVDMSESVDMLADLNALAEVCEPGTVVLALGIINDVGIYRDLINSGIHDYLVKPIDQDILREAVISGEVALHAPAEQEEVAAAPSEKSTIVVIGSRGGVGATTVAANIAQSFSEFQKNMVAFLDLDVQFGTGAMQFDLEPGRGLFDALENPARVDGLFIERAMVKAGDNLSILGSEASINAAIIPEANSIDLLIHTLTNNFDTVVVDMPRHILGQHPNAVDKATDIVVVSDLSLASTRDTIRLFAHLQLAAQNAKIHLVVNRASAGGANEVDIRDFSASVEHEVDVTIPDDRKLMIDVARKGRPLVSVSPASKPSQAIGSLIGRLTNSTSGPEKEKSGFWGNLFSK